MPAFFSKLFTYFCLKLQKNAVFPLYWKISIVEVRLRFNLVQKCCFAMAKLCCMSTELKSLAYRGSCAQVQKLKKLNCAFCAVLLVYWLKRSLRCAFDIKLLVPTSAAGRQTWFCVAY